LSALLGYYYDSPWRVIIMSKHVFFAMISRYFYSSKSG
jgi:hypothetical protein